MDLARAFANAGAFDVAHAALSEALEVPDDDARDRRRDSVLRWAANIRAHAGQVDAALQDARAIGVEAYKAVALGDVARALARLARPAEARDILVEGLDVIRGGPLHGAGDAELRAVVLMELGDAAQALGRTR